MASGRLAWLYTLISQNQSNTVQFKQHITCLTKKDLDRKFSCASEAIYYYTLAAAGKLNNYLCACREYPKPQTKV